jgi:tyrosyl-tRNA synthetase
MKVIDLIVLSGLEKSKSAARRLIEQGGFHILSTFEGKWVTVNNIEAEIKQDGHKIIYLYDEF